MTRTLKVLALALLTSAAIAQTKINPKTQIAWPAGCVYYNVNTATCPALGVVTFRGTWNSASTYATNDAVFYNGTQYVSLQNSNINHAPDVSPTYWTVLVAGSAVQVNGVSLQSPSPQNFQDSSTVTFQNTSAGNISARVSTTTLAQGVVAPLSSGQNVVLYPTAFSNQTGDSGTGNVSAGKLATFISNGPGGGSLSSNTWGTTFSGFALPGDIPAANVTAVYPFMVSSVAGANSATFTYGSCTDGMGHSPGFTPGGGVVTSNVNWNLQQFTGGSGIAGTSIGLVTCTAQTQRSSFTTITEAYNVPAVGLIVYYTGTPSTYGSTAAQVKSPLYFNAALNQLGVDPNAAFHGSDLQGIAIASLPTSPLSTSQAVLINNGATTSDCTAGGGSNYVLCRWNGTNWASFVTSSGGVTGINGTAGAYTFGAGASCSGTTCTFPGTGVGGASNPATCTASSPGYVCLTDSTYNASTAGATTTTTSGTFAAGTSGTVASCSTFNANNGVFIAGAGAAGANYIGTVVTCSGTTLTITPATSTSVGGGAAVRHDETNAIQTAITNLTAVGGGTIYYPLGVYRSNGPLQETSGANAIIKMPTVALNLQTVVPITFQGLGEVGSLNQANTGVILQTDQSTGNFIGGFISGGPFGGFINTRLTVNNMRIRVPDNPSINGINAKYMPTFQSTDLWTDTPSSSTPSTGTGEGVIMPTLSNDVELAMRRYTSLGFRHGVVTGEHATLYDPHCANEISCVVLSGGGTGPNPHDANSVVLIHPWAQVVTNFLEAAATYPTQVHVIAGDAESVTHVLNDPSNLISGTIEWNVPHVGGSVTYCNPNNLGGANPALALISMQCPTAILTNGELDFLQATYGATADVSITHPVSGRIQVNGLFSLSGLTGTNPICPNGTGNGLTNTGCVATNGNFGGGAAFFGGVNAQTGTTYAIASTDENKTLTLSNASAIGVSMPAASTTGFGAGAVFDIVNLGAGIATITPTTSTINGSSSLVLATGQSAHITSDGTNYIAGLGAGAGGYTGTAPIVVSGPNISCPTCSTGGGTSVQVNGGTALGTANLNNTTPAAPAGGVNLKFQQSGTSISGYITTLPMFPSSMTAPVSTNFTWVNPGSETTFDKTNRMVVTLPSNSAVNGRFLVSNTAIPATPYTITVCGSFTGQASGTNGQMLGVALLDNSNNAVTFSPFVQMATFPPVLFRTKWTSTGTVTSNTTSAAMNTFANQFACSRVTDDGTNRKFYFSNNGQDYRQYSSEVTNTDVTPTKMGMLFYNNAGTFTTTEIYDVYWWDVQNSILPQIGN